MPDLLNAQDLTEITSAFLDLSDTFLKDTCQIQIAGQHFDRFGESETNRPLTNHTVKCLIVEAKTKTGSEVLFEQKGRLDMREAYVILYFADLVGLGLATANGEISIRPDKDFIIINGDRLEIKAATTIPKLSVLRSFVKIVFRKNLIR